jgi:hypothetical protein
MSEWSSHIAAQECTVQLRRLVRMRFLCQPIIPLRMVAMGFLSRRSESLVSCGRTEAAYAIPVVFLSCAFTFCICAACCSSRDVKSSSCFCCASIFRCALKFVEQHRVDHFVVNTLWLPTKVVRHQSGIHFRYFLSDQAKRGLALFLMRWLGLKLRRWSSSARIPSHFSLKLAFQ